MFDTTFPAPSPILIVDDVAENISLLNHAISGLGEVLFATEGKEALRIARERRPSVVLLDIEMPEMDGYAVCRALKADALTADCAIIFVTAHDSPTHELEALTSGGTDFLSKPINSMVARARVATQLTLKRQAEELFRAKRDLSDVVHNLPAFVAYWGTDLRNRFCNDSEGQWFGIPAEDMTGLSLNEVMGGQLHALLEAHIGAVLQGHDSSFELPLETDHRPIRYTQASLVCSHGAGQCVGFTLLLTDISDLKYVERALYDEKERMRITLSSIGDAVIATDVEGRVTFLNPIAEAMTGWHSEKALGEPIETVMPLRDATTGTPMRNPIRLALHEKRVVGMAMNCVLNRSGDREFAVEDSAAPIRDHAGAITGAIIVFHDVSEARAMAIKMSHLAQHDPLTDLPNRLLLQDRISQALQHAQRNSTRVAILLIDVDHFKFINDSVGHSVGDELLQQFAARLSKNLRASDTISRQGGDEFVILLPELDSIERAGAIANKLIEATTSPFLIRQSSLNITISIGISLFPDDSKEQETLLRHADAAMYQAKQEGRNRCRFFSSDIEEMTLARNALQRRLQTALEKQHFEIFYQAKVDARTNVIVGLEALIRLRHESGALIPPSEFIPLAEEIGLIIPIGKLVLIHACEQAQAWCVEGHKLSVSVNISAVQFAQQGFPALVEDALIETGLAPELLELEITEGMLMRNVESARMTLAKLKQLGVRISIDDFGTGYSSLAYLACFPVDVLKIDRSFVRDMATNPSNAAIIAAIINLGQSLGLELIAEGVETIEQSGALLQLGCHIMQGYLYSLPIPGGEMGRKLRVGITAPALCGD